MRLSEWFKKYARGRGVGVAEELKRRLQAKLSVQAPLRVTKGGRVVAATKATPYAPPRRVLGDLLRSVVVVRTAHGARLVIYAPYGWPLEKSKKWHGWPHAYLSVVLAEMGITGRNS